MLSLPHLQLQLLQLTSNSRVSLLWRRQLARDLTFLCKAFWKKVTSLINRLLFIITLLTLLLTAGVDELIRTYASLVYRSAVLSLEIVEINHNVSVWVKKIPSMMPQPRPHVLETVTCMTLLHPDDATRAKELHLSTSSLNGHQQVGFENFLTSKQL